jgi:AcrR family transcriptional regulator
MTRRAGISAREVLLRAALRQFAARGYAGASTRDIIAGTGFTLPTLYYHFGSKAGVYKALLNRAFEEAFERLQEAAVRGDTLEDQLLEMAVALFEFARTHRDMTRLAFATVFAPGEEVPRRALSAQKRRRNLLFFEALFRRALAGGALQSPFRPQELAEGFYSVIVLRVMRGLLDAVPLPGRRETRRMVRLLLDGARARPDSPAT